MYLLRKNVLNASANTSNGRSRGQYKTFLNFPYNLNKIGRFSRKKPSTCRTRRMVSLDACNNRATIHRAGDPVTGSHHPYPPKTTRTSAQGYDLSQFYFQRKKKYLLETHISRGPIHPRGLVSCLKHERATVVSCPRILKNHEGV